MAANLQRTTTLPLIHFQPVAIVSTLRFSEDQSLQTLLDYYSFVPQVVAIFMNSIMLKVPFSAFGYLPLVSFEQPTPFMRRDHLTFAALQLYFSRDQLQSLNPPFMVRE